MAKGKKLISPPSRTHFIRPTSDRAREALFNILGGHVRGARVLDLFAGTGALGIEALSRGAEYAVFIDHNHKALKVIEKNIRFCLPQVVITRHLQQTSECCNQALLHKSSPSATVLKRDSTRNLVMDGCSFDLIFLDPPYSKGLALQCLKNIDQLTMITTNCIIVVEESSKVRFPESVGGLHLFDQRRYGSSSFWFYHGAGTKSI